MARQLPAGRAAHRTTQPTGQSPPLPGQGRQAGQTRFRLPQGTPTQTTPQAFLTRFLKYVEKTFALREQWRKARDARVNPRIAAPVFPALWFLMFASRQPSFNALLELRASKAIARYLGVARMPSAKEMAIVSESADADQLRACLGDIMHKLRRNKVLTPRHGLMLAAIDGHETHSSYKRRHEHSLEREITVNGRKVIQYYNRFTVFQIIGKNFYMLLDAEPVLPGDDEVASAMRLLARVLANHPRCFDVLTCDAIYLRPSIIDMLAAAGKHLVATLKENQPGLLAEARALLPGEPPEHLDLPDAPGKSARHAELREADGFTTDTIHTPLRVVHSRETGIRHELIAKETVHTPYATEWYWATTMPSGLNAPAVVHEYGHNRWRVENEGFNELVTRWHSRHVFHHHANSILALWLVMFIAHAVFHCFLRNLQPVLRRAHEVVHFAKLIAADLLLDRWWPPHPP